MPDSYQLTIDGQNYALNWAKPTPPSSADFQSVVDGIRSSSSHQAALKQMSTPTDGSDFPSPMMAYDAAMEPVQAELKRRTAANIARNSADLGINPADVRQFGTSGAVQLAQAAQNPFASAQSFNMASPQGGMAIPAPLTPLEAEIQNRARGKVAKQSIGATAGQAFQQLASPGLNKIVNSAYQGLPVDAVSPSAIAPLLDAAGSKMGMGDNAFTGYTSQKGFLPAFAGGLASFAEPDALATLAVAGGVTAPLGKAGHIASLAAFGTPVAAEAVQKAREGDYGGAAGSVAAFMSPFALHAAIPKLSPGQEATGINPMTYQRGAVDALNPRNRGSAFSSSMDTPPPNPFDPAIPQRTLRPSSAPTEVFRPQGGTAFSLPPRSVEGAPYLGFQPDRMMQGIVERGQEGAIPQRRLSRGSGDVMDAIRNPPAPPAEPARPQLLLPPAPLKIAPPRTDFTMVDPASRLTPLDEAHQNFSSLLDSTDNAGSSGLKGAYVQLRASASRAGIDLPTIPSKGRRAFYEEQQRRVANELSPNTVQGMGTGAEGVDASTQGVSQGKSATLPFDTRANAPQDPASLPIERGVALPDVSTLDTSRQFAPVGEPQLPKAEGYTAGKRVKPETPSESVPAGNELLATGSDGVAHTADKTAVPYRYALAPLDSLVPSQTDSLADNPRFDRNLQPRDRERGATAEQVSSETARMKPSLLGENTLTNEGAPMLSQHDMQVESGNGRTLGLRHARANEPAKWAEYQDWLHQNAAHFGLDPAQVEAAQRDGKSPVLVRVRQSGEGRASQERYDMARRMGERTGLAMSESENATNDARILHASGALTALQPGSVTSAANRPFLQRWLSAIPEAERGALWNDGKLTAAGARRLSNAVKALAYDNPQTLQRLTEDFNPENKNIGRAMEDVAPQIARTRQTHPHLDISQNLSDAANTVTHLRSKPHDLSAQQAKLVRARTEGLSPQVAQHIENIATPNMFGESADPVTTELVKLLDRNSRSAGRITRVLEIYHDIAGKSSDGGLLGGEAHGGSKLELLKRAVELAKSENVGGDLLHDESAPSKDFGQRVHDVNGMTTTSGHTLRVEGPSGNYKAEDVFHAKRWNGEAVRQHTLYFKKEKGGGSVPTPPEHQAFVDSLFDAAAKQSGNATEPSATVRQMRDRLESPAAAKQPTASDGGGGGLFDRGGATATAPSKAPATVRPIEIPEMVSLARELLGKFPEIAKLRNAYGVFRANAQNARIQIDPKTAFSSEQLSHTLAHEIGHAVDYLPEGTMSRGNILGRLASLMHYMKSTLDAVPTDPSEALTPADIEGIRKQAQEEAKARPDGVKYKAAYQEAYTRLRQEAVDSRNLVTKEEIHNELWGMSQWWREVPANAGEKHMRYRQSSKELYADAYSVLLNAPAEFQARAPKTWDVFHRYMDAKPEVQDAYNEIQDRLGHGDAAVYDQRSADIRAGFDRGAEAYRGAVAERKAGDKQTWGQKIATLFSDNAAAVTQLEKKAGRRDPFKRTASMAMDDLNVKDNKSYLMLHDIQSQVVEPLNEIGVTNHDMGEFLFARRIADGGRKTMGEEFDINSGKFVPVEGDIANPYGHTPETAQATLDGLKNRLGATKYAELESRMGAFDAQKEKVLENAYDAGLISDETMKTVRDNMGNYAAFAVVDHFGDYVSSAMSHQVGTFKEVSNPLDATVMKLIAINRAADVNRAKGAVLVDFMEKEYPDDVKRLKSYPGGPEPRPGKGKEKTLYLDKGKPVWFETDPYVANVFNRTDYGTLQTLSSAFSAKVYKIYHPLYVAFNPLFQAKNLLRDANRTYRNVGGIGGGEQVVAPAIGLAKGYAKSVKPAFQAGFGEAANVPQVRSMLEEGGIGRRMVQSKGDVDTPYEDMLRKHGLLDAESKPTPKFIGAVKNTLEFVHKVGEFIEFLGKLGANEYLKTQGLSDAERVHALRNYASTPNHLKRGEATSLTNSVFMYSNIAIQGYAADAALAIRPKSAAGFWLRSALVTGIPTLAAVAAAKGVFGSGVQGMMNKAGEQDRKNYNVIPLGLTSGKGKTKVAIFRLPPEDTERDFRSALYEAAMGHPASAFESLASAVPLHPNPLFTQGGAWKGYLSGQNPTDSFRGKPIISDKNFRAGGKPALEDMARWTANQYGVISTAVNTFFPKHSDQSINMLDKAVQLSGAFQPFIKITDQGDRDAEFEAKQAVESKRAQVSTSLSQDTQDLVSEWARLNSVKQAGTMNAEQTARFGQLNAWYQRAYLPSRKVLNHAEGDAKSQVIQRLDASAKGLR